MTGDESSARLPRYVDLPVRDDAPPGSSWGVFGTDDEIGTINWLTPNTVRDAASLVRRGAVFSLNWRMDLPSPAIMGRPSIRQKPIRLGAGWDDQYDEYNTQSSSQWDSLAHVAHPLYGFYQGRDRDTVTATKGGRNGIDNWARRGLAGRFVLLDLARHLNLEPDQATAIRVADLEATLVSQGLTLHPGDVLLLNYGWIDWYNGLSFDERRELAELEQFPCPGLEPSEAIAAWLWDNQVAAIAADNPAVELMPFDESDPDAFLHYRLIALLGFALGEMFDLRALVEDCRNDGVYEGLFCSAPLTTPGGAGSPANALAIK